MTKLVSREYRSGLSRLLSQATFQLALLRSQWPVVESSFKREQLRLTRKIPPDDPVRLGVNLLAPINCSLDETLHTRALSYLLDPAAPHGFKKKVLTSFIEKVQDVSPRGSGAAALLALLRRKRTKVSVTPEYRYRVADSKRSVARCDIWIELHAAGAAGLMIIENKIKAPEHNDQLTWYGKKARAWTKENLKALEPLCVYLTRTDKQNLKEPWLRLTYIELAAVLRRVWEENQDAVGREWLALYIASITSGVLKIKGNALEKATLNEIEEYLWEGA